MTTFHGRISFGTPNSPEAPPTPIATHFSPISTYSWELESDAIDTVVPETEIMALDDDTTEVQSAEIEEFHLGSESAMPETELTVLGDDPQARSAAIEEFHLGSESMVPETELTVLGDDPQARSAAISEVYYDVCYEVMKLENSSSISDYEAWLADFTNEGCRPIQRRLYSDEWYLQTLALFCPSVNSLL